MCALRIVIVSLYMRQERPLQKFAGFVLPNL